MTFGPVFLLIASFAAMAPATRTTPTASAPAQPPPATTMTPTVATPASTTATTTATVAPAATTPGASAGERGLRRVVRVAVRDFAVGSTDDARLGRVVTDALVVELRKLDHVSVTSMDEVRALLSFEAERELAGCTEGSCLAEIVEALGVDLLVTGRLERIGDERVFTARVLDQREARTVAEVSRRLVVENGEESLAMVGPAVAQLFPGTPLRPGAVRGVDPSIALRLNPPPLAPWVPLTGLMVTGASAALAVGATVVNANAFADGSALVASATPAAPVDGPTLVKQQRAVETSFLVIVGAGLATAVAGAGTVVAALFTDWRAVDDDDGRL